MSGYIRAITEVKLCYAPYHDPEKQNTLWLLPVWRAVCAVEADPAHETEIDLSPEGETIDRRIWGEAVFEAQCGTMMNRRTTAGNGGTRRIS